jgi:hypothetical protein
MPTAPQHDATDYAAKLAQWWDAQAAAAKQWTPFEIGVCIVAGIVALAILGLWARSIQHKTLLSASFRPPPNPPSQFSQILQEMKIMAQEITDLTAQLAKSQASEQAAGKVIQDLTTLAQQNAATIQTLQGQVTDAAQIPPVTKALSDSEAALDPIVAAGQAQLAATPLATT